MSVNIQTGNVVKVQSGNRVLISAPGPQGPQGPAGTGGTPGGTDTQVQFNDSSAFGGDAGLTYNKTTDTLSATNLTVSGLSTLNHIHGSLAGNLYVHVKNTSGGTLAKGTPVYATGSVGASGEIEVAAADYTNAAKMPAIGILDAALGVNAEGNAVVVGEVTALATNSYAINQELFVGTNGLLGALPSSGQSQSIAVVSRVHASTGIIVVNAQARLNAALTALANNNGASLTGITAAQVGAIANGDSPTFDEITLTDGILKSATGDIDANIFDVVDSSATPYIGTRLYDDQDPPVQIGFGLLGFRGDGAGSGTAFIQGSTADFRIEQNGGTLANVYGLTFNGSGAPLTSLNAGNISTGTLGVARGGTGASTLTANNVLLGNGTSALQTVAPGTNGNVLTSNGTTWTSASGFNGTVGAVTPAAGTFTILNANTFGAALEREMVRPATWQIPWRSDLGTSTTAGSGSVNASNWSVNCQTGTTTSSRAQRALILAGVSDTFTAGPAVDSRVIDWSKRVTVGFAFNLVSASTNGQVFVRIGNSCSTSGNLSGSGMGIRINNTALVAQCHNGTTLNTSASLKTNTAGTTTSTVIVLQSDGAGNVAVYVDNVLAVTMTGGPTTAGFATDFLAVEAINNTDASSTRVHVSPIKYYTTY